MGCKKCAARAEEARKLRDLEVERRTRLQVTRVASSKHVVSTTKPPAPKP